MARSSWRWASAKALIGSAAAAAASAARYASNGRSAPAQWRASSAVAAAGSIVREVRPVLEPPGKGRVEVTTLAHRQVELDDLPQQLVAELVASVGPAREDPAGGGLAERRADLPRGQIQDRGEESLVHRSARDGEGSHDGQDVIVQAHDPGHQQVHERGRDRVLLERVRR